MKCPKCNYLGFETGDRCKHCGYDFSLMATVSEPDEVEVDLMIELAASEPPSASWLDQIDQALAQSTLESDPEAPKSSFGIEVRPPEAAVPPPAPSPAPAPVVPVMRMAPQPAAPPADAPMPLFARFPADDDDDQPLIKLPAAPRAPLAVRKTPEIPRLRAVPRPARQAEPALEFSEDIGPDIDEAPRAPAPAVAIPLQHAVTSGAGARAAAVAIDHGILFAIDMGVLYFTLRMAGLSMTDWRALPVAPLLTFLLFLKLAYFFAFTAVSGQTIGKMATKIRVVTDRDEAVDGARALQRTIAAAVSALVFGLGFVPALIGGDRRALHDRVAHTRVVTLRSV